ncbi:hypothetical protein CRN79_25395 [Serratia fonticola]|uniref:phage terminase small subunit n=1 Tax=Serratia fonticola TaxID=47917 RepID=UPI000BFDDF13|nr:phage terminase small subunit [Serratia fonticola]ATM78963.1 hypothetical protein CRN79_25395 [Serratia fonticola]
MSSPFANHRQRVLAAKHSQGSAADAPRQDDAYALMLHQLHQDMSVLRGIQSQQLKAERKALMLPRYADWVSGVLEQGTGAQDDVITRVMVWRFDAGDLAGGLDIAQYVLANGLTPPDGFERTAGCLVAEEVADYALSVIKQETPIDPSVLQRACDMTEPEDLPDIIRARLYKATGMAYRQAGNLAAAKEAFETALFRDEGSGVKTMLKQVDKELSAAAEATKP